MSNDRVGTEPQRRVEDRDSMIHARLDQMERDRANLTTQVTLLESSVNIVKLEQGHLKDLFEARLKVIEKSQDVQLSETRQIAKDILLMSNEVDKTPATRELGTRISGVQTSVAEHEKALENIQTWKNNVEGVIAIGKWVGAAGLLALALSVFRLLKG